jgi:hypothetical protein
MLLYSFEKQSSNLAMVLVVIHPSLYQNNDNEYLTFPFSLEQFKEVMFSSKCVNGSIDVVRYMKSKNRANSSDVALKLVYSKNYDRTY